MSQTMSSAQIQVRTSIENREWLRRAADEQERSVNWFIHKMLTDARLAAEAAKNVGK